MCQIEKAVEPGSEPGFWTSDLISVNTVFCLDGRCGLCKSSQLLAADVYVGFIVFASPGFRSREKFSSLTLIPEDLRAIR